MRRWLAPVLALALVGCALPGAPARTAAPAPAGSKKPAAKQPPTVLDPTGAVSPLTPASARPSVVPGVAADPTLTGKVKLPVGLASKVISDNGGGVLSQNGANIISQNGAGVVSNGGSRYALRALAAQVPVAGAKVALVDAAGRALAGPDGQPLTAVTAADGSFAFTAALPAANLLAVVDLGADGAAVATVVRGRTGALELDVVSTLASTYILDRYVRTQADALTTFEKLTPAAEAGAREATAAALANGADVASLRTDAVVAVVDGLRKQDTRLDAQMEVVRKLLVAAGQADQGNGLVATQVALGLVSGVTTAPDGTVYFAVYHQRRIFKLAGDKLVAVVGTGAEAEAAPADGAPAATTAIRSPADVVVDSLGRLVFRDGDGAVYRVEPGGALKKLHDEPGGNLGVGLVAGPDGEVWAGWEQIVEPPDEASEGGRSTYVLRAIGATTREVASWEGEHGVQAVVGDPASGAMWVCDRHGRRRLDLATGQLAAADGALTADDRWSFDQAGRLYVEGDDGYFTIAPGSTARVRIADEAPYELMMATGFPIWTAADGAAYLRDFNSVFKLQAGTVTRVAGTGGSGGQTGGDGAVALEAPGSLVAGPADTFWVADSGASRVLKYAPGQPVQVYEDPQIPAPGTLRLGPDGKLYVLHDDGGNGGPAIYRFDAPGRPAEEVWSVTAPACISDFAVAPDGSLAALIMPDEGGDVMTLRRLKPGGGGPSEAMPAPPTRYVAMAYDAAGTLHLAGGGKAWKLDGAAFKLVGSFGVGDAHGLAIDARGRLYALAEGDLAPTVRRLDPASGKAELVAGKGSQVLAGDTPDTGLGYAVSGLAIDAAGNLFLSDAEHRQVKKAPAAQLN